MKEAYDEIAYGLGFTDWEGLLDFVYPTETSPVNQPIALAIDWLCVLHGLTPIINDRRHPDLLPDDSHSL